MVPAGRRVTAWPRRKAGARNAPRHGHRYEPISYSCIRELLLKPYIATQRQRESRRLERRERVPRAAADDASLDGRVPRSTRFVVRRREWRAGRHAPARRTRQPRVGDMARRSRTHVHVLLTIIMKLWESSNENFALYPAYLRTAPSPTTRPSSVRLYFRGPPRSAFACRVSRRFACLDRRRPTSRRPTGRRPCIRSSIRIRIAPAPSDVRRRMLSVRVRAYCCRLSHLQPRLRAWG